MTTFSIPRVTDPEVQRALDEIAKALNFIGQCEYAGTGSPEGVITAPPGSRYRRIDGGAATSLYVKESAGTLNTGWAAK